MKHMPIKPDKLFDPFPEPVLLLRAGQVTYHNPAAARVIPALATGVAYRELMDQPDEEGATQRLLGGREWVTSFSPVGQDTLVILRPTLKNVPPRDRRLEVLTGQLRRQMASLFAAIQQVEVLLGERESDAGERHLAVLYQSVHRILRLLGSVELSQALAEESDAFSPMPLDLTELCLALGREAEPLVETAGRRFCMEVAQAGLLVKGDAQMLRRALLALLSNAIKAAGKDGTLGLRLSKKNERAVLTVWDSGPGMEERSLAALFQNEGPACERAPDAGLGEGMEQVRRIAALHEGTVMVESRRDVGVQVTVSLPLVRPEKLPLRTPSTDSGSMGGFSVVLVELSDALPWQAFRPADLE